MKLPYFFLAVALVVIAVVAMLGFRGHHFDKPPFEIFPDMNYQAKVKDQQPSNFFADGMASREPVKGTIAEEMPAKIDYWASGKWDDTHWGDGIPVHPAQNNGRALGVSDFDMARGRERYQINCAVCHGATGAGNGITSQYGLNGAANYNTDRLRTTPDGDLFNTITNGKGQMMGYGYNIDIDDRWRIVMYIRALQRSANAKLQDASSSEQQELNKAKKPAAGSTSFVSPQNPSHGGNAGAKRRDAGLGLRLGQVAVAVPSDGPMGTGVELGPSLGERRLPYLAASSAGRQGLDRRLFYLAASPAGREDDGGETS